MFHLEIVTPYRQFFCEEVEMVIVRGMEGDLAILEGKSPIITPLKIGRIIIKQEGVELMAAVVDGYVSVLDNKATIVTEAADWPNEIDVKRAEKAKERAENRMRQEKETIDVDRAELALKRAINRLELSKRDK